MLPTKSTMLSPSVHDMCLWAHEPCLGLPTACARSLAGSAGPTQIASEHVLGSAPKGDAHKGGRPAPMAGGRDEQRRADTHREGRTHPTEGSARRGLANMLTAEGPTGFGSKV